MLNNEELLLASNHGLERKLVETRLMKQMIKKKQQKKQITNNILSKKYKIPS